MMRWVRGALLAMLCIALCACSQQTGQPEPPVLRLSPASLGRTLALQQRLTVQVRGHEQQVDVVLEADREVVRMALLVLGQAAARLEWDGTQLRETRAPGWPEVVRGERILSDVQLMYWPAEAVRAALPAGWTLQADAARRVLAQGGRTVAEVRYVAANVTELSNSAAGYSLRVESKELGS
jgi:hypothetical protein